MRISDVSVLDINLLCMCPNCGLCVVYNLIDLQTENKKCICEDCGIKFKIPKIKEVRTEIVFENIEYNKKKVSEIDKVDNILIKMGYNVRNIVEDCYIEGYNSDDLLRESLARIIR